MSREEFIKYIESIGFKYNSVKDKYEYKEFGIYLYYNFYNFYIGSKWFYYIPYTDLEIINKYFKHELRSIKLKSLLYCNIS